MPRLLNLSSTLLFWTLVPAPVYSFLSTKTTFISANTGSTGKIISNDIHNNREGKFSFISTAATNSPSLSSLYSSSDSNDSNGEILTIEYCTGCRWLLRSAWLMQEIFTTFHDEMGSITLIPSKPPSPGGTFVSFHCLLLLIVISSLDTTSIFYMKS